MEISEGNWIACMVRNKLPTYSFPDGENSHGEYSSRMEHPRYKCIPFRDSAVRPYRRLIYLAARNGNFRRKLDRLYGAQ